MRRRRRYHNNALVTVPTDGPDSVFVPQSAADFTSLGIVAANSLWQMQESAVPLADSIGAITWSQDNGTPEYQQSVSGWDRLFIKISETSFERVNYTSGDYQYGSGTSAAFLTYFHGLEAVNTNRGFMLHSGNTNKARITNAGVVSWLVQSVATVGSYNYEDGAAHPFLFVYNATDSTVKLFSDQEVLTGTFNATITAGQRGIGDVSGTAAVSFSCWSAAWFGANAETIDQTTLTKLGWALAY